MDSSSFSYNEVLKYNSINGTFLVQKDDKERFSKKNFRVVSKRKPSKWQEHKPILRLVVLFGKNIIGFSLIIGGLLMLVLPGQGLLTIVTGLLLINYPGKYKLEQKLVTIPSIFRALNWIRVKANKPPLKRKTAHQ